MLVSPIQRDQAPQCRDPIKRAWRASAGQLTQSILDLILPARAIGPFCSKSTSGPLLTAGQCGSRFGGALIGVAHPGRCAGSSGPSMGQCWSALSTVTVSCRSAPNSRSRFGSALIGVAHPCRRQWTKLPAMGQWLVLVERSDSQPQDCQSLSALKLQWATLLAIGQCGSEL